MATVPFDLAFNLAVGSSFALASRLTLRHEALLRAVSLWALLGLEAVVLVPIAAYLLWRFPEWSLMYLARAGSLGVPDVALAGANVATAVLGWLVVRGFVRRGKTFVGLGFAAAGLLLACAVAAFGHQQLSMVGSTEQFVAGHGAMLPIGQTPLVWVLLEAAVGTAAAWGWSLWRVVLYSRAYELHELDGTVNVGTGDLKSVPVDPTQRRQRK